MSCAVIGVCIAGVGAATGIFSAVSQGKATQKGLLMQDVASQLDRKQKGDLEKALQKTQSDTQRLKILTDSVANIKIAQQQALISTSIASREEQKKADKRNLIIVGVGGGAIVVGALAVLKLT
tara:strand:+ start:10642 stop:11010 length:369 start_codon:yes stop_codon:yes gene_type:complete